MPIKTLKSGPQKLLIIGPNLLFTVQPSPEPIAHSPELIFHIINMSQDSSVSLSVAMAVINLHFQGGPPLSNSRQSLVGCLSIPFHLLIGNLQLPSGQSAGQGGVYYDGENIMKQSDAEILCKTTTLVMKIILT